VNNVLSVRFSDGIIAEYIGIILITCGEMWDKIVQKTTFTAVYRGGFC
jgi:hypothetical protein